jgi:hypothetical protein
MSTTSEQDLIAALRATGEELPKELHDSIVARGADIVPALIDVLERDEDEDDEDDDGGWGPIHAVDLLVDLKAKAAIDPMLEILAETGWEHIIHDRIVTRLPELGALVLEPALAMLDPEDEPESHGSICCVLSMLGIKDERIFSALCTAFEEDAISGAMCMGDYGDVRAVPMIEEAILGFEIDRDEGMGLLGLDELVEAYVQLEGELPEKVRAHVSALKAEWNARDGAKH